MATQPTREAERTGGAPVGTVNVVDPHPLNWLYITWNTMEGPVRTDERAHMVGAVMEESRWTDEKTIEIKVRQGIRFQDGEECTAHSVKRAFDEMPSEIVLPGSITPIYPVGAGDRVEAEFDAMGSVSVHFV